MTSDNIHYGTIHNPWDTGRIPGGSSGGSGAATAAGLAFAATGSDTGGSIRCPAALCGTVGLMPTYGRVSLRGAVPLSWTMDHAGPLTRTVRDAAIMLQAMAGYDPGDPASIDRAVPDYLEGIDQGAKGLCVGVPKQHFWQNLDAPVEKVTRAAVDALANAGSAVVDVDWPQAVEYVRILWDVSLCEASAFHAPWFPSRRDEYDPQVAALLDAGNALPGARVAAVRRIMDEARAGAADAILARHNVDVLVIPTAPCVASKITETPAAASGRIVAWTGIIDFTGQPAIAVPCGLTDDGLPASITFVGRRWDEPSMLRAARAYELVRGPFPSPPV
jgi:aspartyl-tRNA(Asn)/glutamyl-tRNA(Gln) amidotransferase subunit A